ncbi:transposase [Saccharothrix sp. NRRL B-16314]|uniref:transposase n=1 Tax=Saccharothrix sp. NRRL B-16314 TaxID=1463825 RepID=UPI0009DD1337
MRSRAVRLYREPDPKLAIAPLARQLGVHHEALRTWIRRGLADRAVNEATDPRPDTRTWSQRRDSLALPATITFRAAQGTMFSACRPICSACFQPCWTHGSPEQRCSGSGRRRQCLGALDQPDLETAAADVTPMASVFVGSGPTSAPRSGQVQPALPRTARSLGRFGRRATLRFCPGTQRIGPRAYCDVNP